MKKIILTFFAISFAVSINAQVSEKDKEFVRCAASAGVMEVKLGELAQANGASQQVKDLGQHMIDDHSKAAEELKSLAAKKNLPVPPSSLNDKGQKAYEKLSKLQGKEFDKAYTKCMVKAHKKVISNFKKELAKGNDVEIKDWASKTLPTLESHERMAEEVNKVAKNEK